MSVRITCGEEEKKKLIWKVALVATSWKPTKNNEKN